MTCEKEEHYIIPVASNSSALLTESLACAMLKMKERKEREMNILSFWPVTIAFACGVLATAGPVTFIVTTLLTIGGGWLMAHYGMRPEIATVAGWLVGLIVRYASPNTFDDVVDSIAYIDLSGGDCGGSFGGGGCDGGGGGD